MLFQTLRRSRAPTVPRRLAVLMAASLLLLALGGCDKRGDLLGVELVVFTLGEWGRHRAAG